MTRYGAAQVIVVVENGLWWIKQAMTRYEVQYTLPVDNPVNNVSKKVGKGTVTFFVPINHPDAHNMGFQDLIAAQELSGLLTVSPTLNNKTGLKKGN